MPIFFSGPVGRTVGCPDQHTSGTFTFVKVDPAISWESHTSIITRITVAEQGNYQFLHTIGNDVYIYVFGDRMGSVTISGLSMTTDCSGSVPKGGEHGFEKIMQWYKKNRVAARKEPVRVTIGEGTHFEGFVVGLTGDVVDVSMRLVQYGLQIVTLPEKR